MAEDRFDGVSDDTANPDVNSPEFTEGGKNIRKAISGAGQALSIATRLVQEDWQRDNDRARVMAAFTGQPPYSETELRSKGQAWRYNVSFGFMEGVIGRAVAPYNDLTLNISNLAEIEADLPNQKRDIIREEFVDIIRNHGKWPKFVSRLNQDLVLNGYNSAVFPSDYDFFPVFIPQKEGFVTEGTLNSVDDLEVFVWKHDYLIHQLYDHIENEDAAEKAGWNLENVRNALMNAMPKEIWSSNPNGSGTWTAVEQAIRGGSLLSSTVGAKVVETFHVFASEIDGPVTHYIVLNSASGTNAAYDGAIELFKKERRFPSFKSMLVYFDLETGDGTWHGSRGLGRRAFNTHRAIDKLRCSILDTAFSSTLKMIQANDQASQEDFQLAVLGPFMALPSGITIAQADFPQLSQQIFAADNLLSATSAQRIGDVVPDAGSAITGGQKTATEARIDANRSLLIGKNNLQRYVDPLGSTLSIMLHRLLKENSPDPYAKRFREKIMKRGITEEDIRKVRGARSAGRIDEALGDLSQNTQVAYAEFRNDPQIDQVELKRMRLSSILGEKGAEQLLLTDEDQTKVIEASRQQIMELDSIQDGFPVPVSPRDNHLVHLQVVLDWLDGQIQQAGQGAPAAPPDVLKGAAEHAAQHINFLGQDKQKAQVAKKLETDLKSQIKAIQDLEKQQMKLQELQQKQLEMKAPAEAPPAMAASEPPAQPEVNPTV